MSTVAVATQNIPDLLTRLREKGWSDNSIARALGINRTTIWRWRIGARPPHTGQPVAMALVSLFNVEPPSSDT